ncbi:cation transporter [Streptomyces sp. P9(2023)]|uniref:cation transporter n=1 Tax=Streptomyces sp. P9(2023) TaxID=3064394 RepID=UPI0028F441D7|nr:cation transporter [Streptomyces sp. P9(2023)]MDT9692988.1 cation transporter [Streptomyces sp. P9(2023)]
MLFSRKNKAETGAEVVLDIEGMHCTSCGLLIDDELEEVPGVRSASTSFRAGRTTILLDKGAEVDTAELVAAVGRAGEYQARLDG